MENKMRVQKYLANAGICSRRKAEDCIRGGLVRINDQVAMLGDSVTPGRDKVTFEGEEVRLKFSSKLYIMLNKPRGYITSMSDERGRDTASDLLKDINERIYPVGRLDYNSEGLLLFTNDGEMAYRLTHPKYEVEKAYRVTVSGIADDEDLRKLTSPVTIDGEKVQALSVDVVEKRKNATVLEIVIKEGKNREIRRICENCGFLIRRLKRIRVGALSLGDLPTGKWRFLNESEERVLFEMTARQGENFLR